MAVIVKAYFDAIALPLASRDNHTAPFSYLKEPAAFWLARDRVGLCGCIALRPLGNIHNVCELKRLFVEPRARGSGLSDALLDAAESFARQQRFAWAYLDSNAALQAAIKFYMRNDYKLCAKYNDNPDANIFMRKPLL